MNDVAARLTTRVQLTTDGHRAYLEAVYGAFENNIDFAQLQKMYGTPDGTSQTERKYSPAECTGIKKYTISGNPDKEHISTSYVERCNLTMRMHMRRFTRLTNAFSKKVDNHCYAIALHFVYYNFVKIHKTLRVPPAMEAGLIKRLMTIEDIIVTILLLMMKATKINVIREYLTVLGFQLGASVNGFETWEDNKRAVMICVSESHLPVFSIKIMLEELQETESSFIAITSVIR